MAQVMAYPTSTPGGIIVDLDGDTDNIGYLSIDSAIQLANQLRRAVVEASEAIDPESRIRQYLDRVFI